MDKRRCADCIYAVRPVGRWYRMVLRAWGGLLTCLNHPDAPGQMMGVAPIATCRNFRGKGERRPRPEAPEPPDSQSRCIPLTQGKFAIVDAADYEWLSAYRWFATVSRAGGQCYAATSIRGKVVSMHRLIMNPPPGKVVDHYDGNGLNNRRCNLRICSEQENRWNLKPRKTEGKSSRFIGVYRDKRYAQKWYAAVECRGKVTHLGTFASEEEAAIARDLEAIKQHGLFARLNFPELAEKTEGRDQGPEIRDQRPEIKDQRSDVRDQRVEVGDQKSEIRGQNRNREAEVRGRKSRSRSRKAANAASKKKGRAPEKRRSR